MKKKPGRLKKVIKYALVFLGLIVAASAVYVFTKYDFSNPEDLDLFLERKFKKMRAAGLAVTIMEGGEVTYFKGLGYADIENKKEITQDTIFQIASTSKLVTGAAIMQLCEQGLLDIDADINDYLPAGIANPGHPDTAITARMLLTHTSSIKDNYDIYDALYTIESGGGDSPVTLKEFAEGYLLDGGQWYDAEENFAAAAPGTAYEYSNCAYGLLGYLAEEITGQPFSDYCRENIFGPLEMENTGWFLSDVNEESMAIPYDENKKSFPLYGFPTYPDGALKTSSGDFAKFMLAMMNGGEYKVVRILEKDTMTKMLSAQVPELYDNQGITWFLRAPEKLGQDCGGNMVPGHTGGDPGIITAAYFSPAQDKGVIIFFNSDIKESNFLSASQMLYRLFQEVTGGQIR